MTDGEYSLLMLLGLMAALVVYLVAVARNQRKTIAALSSVSGSVADERLSQKEREVEELRSRIQVLERIAVEKENSLAREIEELRDR